MTTEEEIMKPKFKRTTFDRIDFLKIAEATIHATAPYKTFAHFRIDHTRRVYHLAGTLANSYKEGTFDLRKISVMCAIHDMYKYATDMEHGEKAADYLEKIFINEYFPEDHPERDEWMKVVEAVRLHSYKDCEVYVSDYEKNPYLEILRDADMLDKIHFSHIRSLQRVFMKNLSLNEIAIIVKKNIDEYHGISKGYNNLKMTMIDELYKRLK